LTTPVGPFKVADIDVEPRLTGHVSALPQTFSGQQLTVYTLAIASAPCDLVRAA
jgi:hypothetical protein